MAEKNKWEEGSSGKIALHAAVGAVVASITKGNIASGALAGGATEYLAKEILKACKGDKAQAQWVAAIIGAAVSGATGDNPQIGALIAVNAIRNNKFNYDDLTTEDIARMIGDGDPNRSEMSAEVYEIKVEYLTNALEYQIEHGYARLKEGGIEFAFGLGQIVVGGFEIADGLAVTAESGGLPYQ